MHPRLDEFKDDPFCLLLQSSQLKSSPITKEKNAINAMAARAFDYVSTKSFNLR